MPGRQHLRGVSDKEQRQYEHIKESAEKTGRYGKRAEEVAARTVLRSTSSKGTKRASNYSAASQPHAAQRRAALAWG